MHAHCCTEPRVLILDEPTTGLDPQTRRLLWSVLGDLRRKKGLTVFLTTHYMEEAADSDYVVILSRGSIAAEGTPLMLKNRYTSDFITLYGTDEDTVKRLARRMRRYATHTACRSPVPPRRRN